MQTMPADTQQVGWTRGYIWVLSVCLGGILATFVGGGEQDVGQNGGFDALATLVIHAAIEGVLHYRVG